jgi:endo-1,4-beta-D-glucanase Y
MKRRLAVAASIGAVLALVGGLVGLAIAMSGSSEPGASPSVPEPEAAKATDAFFSTYVSPEGRVVRHDQGVDSVSEGQGYAMLLAVKANDSTRFDSIWTWTRDQLQRDDGLVSWRWVDGRVADVNSATDADLDIARALLLAADKFGREPYAVEGRRIANAVLDLETVQVADRRVLVAGPWATADGVVNPSYLARCDFDEFAQATSDPRWTQLRITSYELLGTLVKEALPPDWAIVDSTGRIHAVASPDDRQGPARYGLDAARIPAQLSVCDDGRRLVAALWPRLQALERDGAAISYSTDGRRLDDNEHPLGLVASALAANAAQDRPEAQRRMDAAERLEQRQPTYYGSAWLALGMNILAGDSARSPMHGAAARVGGLRLSGLVLPQSAQATTAITTTTTPSTTVAPTTPTSTIPTSTSPTTTTSTVTATTAPTTTRVTTRSATTLPPTTRPTTAPTSTAPAAIADATDIDPPIAKRDTGDLSSQTIALPGLQPGGQRPSAAIHTPQEAARRRSAALTIGGFTTIAVLGATLGLRERAIIRRPSADVLNKTQ